MEGQLLMSKKEADRLGIIRRVVEKEITQRDAAKRLNLSDRQVRRLLVRYCENGVIGLISRKRGMRSNNRISDNIKEKVLSLIREHYYDFGPTLAAEKLEELHKIRLSKETVRRWMIENGIRKSRPRKTAHIHPQRTRRSRRGELIQIDGSPHDWFEGRRPPCTLIVFIDDATGEYMELFFSEEETTEAYMHTMRMYLAEYGRPRSLYSDRHSIFRVNTPDAQKGSTLTQFGRAIKTLDIELITANSSEAKGRVERANQTLQDRLVKELRLRGINTIEEANEFLKEYKYILSNKFAVKARSSQDAHRSVHHTDEELDLIFSRQETRKISKNLEVRYRNVIYQLQVNTPAYAMRNSQITVSDNFNGKITLLYKGKEIPYKTLQYAKKQLEPIDAKRLNQEVNKIIAEQNGRLDYKYPVDAFSVGYEPLNVTLIEIDKR